MVSTNKSPTFLRALSAGLVGGLAWIGAMVLLFGPAQTILADPGYQSEKFLYVMGQLEPLPHATGARWILFVGLLALGVLYGVVYRFVRSAFSGAPWWSKGLRFGSVAWAFMVPWFEFYLPWNVLHEPVALVIFEMALWLGVLLVVGMAIAGVYEWRVAEETV